MSEQTSNVLELWSEIKAVVSAADVDVTKNASGNASAGVRARKALRLLKGKVGELVKLTIAESKKEQE